MANRRFNRPWALTAYSVTLEGRIPLNSSAAVGTLVGRGFTVAKTGTGLYEITLQDKYPQLLAYSFQPIGTGTIVAVPELKSETVATDGKLVLKTVTRSTGAEADTSVAYDIAMILKLNNSLLT